MNSPQSGTGRPVRRVGLIDQVAARFEQEIATGRWPIGERIPVEAELGKVLQSRDKVTEEQVRAAMRFVPDELVQRITASGTPAEVKAKVREYMNNGATCPILYPLGDVKMMIDTFADGY